MSGTVTGVIDAINPRAIPGKTFKAYDIIVSGQTYEYGIKKPPVAPGQTVSFTWQLSYGKMKIDDGSMLPGAVPASVGGVAAAFPKAPPTTGGQGKAFPVPKNHPDRSIIRQNSLTHATKCLDLMKAHLTAEEFNLALTGDLGLPPEATHFAAKVIELAQHFEAFSSGDLEDTKENMGAV